MLFLILLLLLIPFATAVRESHRAPIIFVPTTAQTNQSEFRGTSIRTDGDWQFGHIDPETVDKLRGAFRMSTIIVINTDDEAENRVRIHHWIDRECTQIQRRDASDCFVLSSLSYAPYKSSTDPYMFRRWEGSLTRVVKHILTPIQPLGTLKPTFALTPSPVVPDACEPRANFDCIGPKCEWLGMMYGCRDYHWCGFRTKMACEHHPGCEFRRNRCRPERTLHI